MKKAHTEPVKGGEGNNHANLDRIARLARVMRLDNRKGQGQAAKS